MNPAQHELWQRIADFAFDDPDARLPFSARLAKDNGWSHVYAQRVIEEYRRFAFLAVAAGHPVSPSDAVDQAWHEHLTYTRSYWDAFCGQVLRCPLHHEPTRGGAAEGAKFADWYVRTRASYRGFFETEPPEDIWPAPEQRARNPERFVRVNAAENWVVRKPQLRREGRWLAVTLPVFALAGCGSVAVMATWGPFDWAGPEFLLFFVIFAVAMFVFAAAVRWGLRGGPARSFDVGNADPYAIAVLAGGPSRALEVALGRLWQWGVLRSDSSERVLRVQGNPPAETAVIERRIFAEAAEARGASRAALLRVAEAAMEPTTRRLQQDGLLLGTFAGARAQIIALLLALSVPLVGLVKIGVGISRQRPVGILVFLSLVTLVVAIGFFRRRPIRTRAGDAVLGRLRSLHPAREVSRSNPASTTPASDFPLGLALFGVAMMPAPLMAMWRETAPPRSYSSGDSGSSSSSCSSGDSGGGSSCGGGSSGCGGCSGGGGGD